MRRRGEEDASDDEVRDNWNGTFHTALKRTVCVGERLLEITMSVLASGVTNGTKLH